MTRSACAALTAALICLVLSAPALGATRSREIGLVNKRFASNRKKARRTLSSWRLR
jgi:hypothetical protein